MSRKRKISTMMLSLTQRKNTLDLYDVSKVEKDYIKALENKEIKL
jgi:hypothetical protein